MPHSWKGQPLASTADFVHCRAHKRFRALIHARFSSESHLVPSCTTKHNGAQPNTHGTLRVAVTDVSMASFVCPSRSSSTRAAKALEPQDRGSRAGRGLINDAKHFSRLYVSCLFLALNARFAVAIRWQVNHEYLDTLIASNEDFVIAVGLQEANISC